MTADAPRSAAELDNQSYLAARDSDHKDLLVHAAKASGRGVLEIQADFGRMARSPSKLNMVEYVRNGLYHKGRHSEAERAAFISNDLHWDIAHTCNDRGWSTVSEDKVIADTILKAAGVPVPETVAVLDASPREYPGVPKLRSADDLRKLVTGSLGDGLFGKIVTGMVSFGAFRIEAGDATHLTCSGHPPMTYEAFLSDFVGTNAYVIQRKLSNHPGFASYCSAVATVRMVNMVSNSGVYCPLAIIKLPQGKNIADAFWRGGNLASEVDVETGVIKTIARRSGPEVEFLPDHPEKPGLMGLKLPHWDRLREINDHAARVFAPIRYQSTDIAITEKGPVIVELNYGGGFDLPQYASGRGLLTPEVRAFFADCGYVLGAPAKGKAGLGRIFGRG